MAIVLDPNIRLARSQGNAWEPGFSSVAAKGIVVSRRSAAGAGRPVEASGDHIVAFGVFGAAAW
jgi:hypothetical protein